MGNRGISAGITRLLAMQAASAGECSCGAENADEEPGHCREHQCKRPLQTCFVGVPPDLTLEAEVFRIRR